MQAQRRRSVMAPLLLAAVVMFAWGMASVVLSVGPHAASAAPTGEKEQATLPSAAQASLTALLQPGAGMPHGKDPGANIPPGKAGPTLEYSYNWAGYVDVAKSVGETYEVTANWYVPKIVSCGESSGTAVEVQWIGIDGWNNGNVSQVGTMSYCSGPGATPAYYDWWEFYPYNDIQTVAHSSAGAYVSAYVLYNPGEEVNGHAGVYTLELYDVDNSVNFVETGGAWVCETSSGHHVCEGGPDAGAECISEAPSGFGHPGYDPLAQYKTTTFYGCATTIGSHFAGIGNQASVGTVYQVDQCNYTACTRILQATGGLSTYFYTDSKFTMTWKAYD